MVISDGVKLYWRPIEQLEWQVYELLFYAGAGPLMPEADAVGGDVVPLTRIDAGCVTFVMISSIANRNKSPQCEGYAVWLKYKCGFW